MGDPEESEMKAKPKAKPQKRSMQDTPAQFAVGDWVWVPLSGGYNARVVAVVWEEDLWNGYLGGWRYWTPGYGSPDMYPEKKDARYVEFKSLGNNCWKEVA